MNTETDCTHILQDLGNLDKHQKSLFIQNGLKDKNIGVGLDTDSPYGGGGGPSKTKSGNVKTRFPTTMKRDIYGSK